MKLLKEISEGSLGIGEFEKFDQAYTLRKSARVILLNERGEMAVQFLANHGYHKIPGGGIETGETNTEALKREVLEEVGCDCEIKSENGMIVEYRNYENLLQFSYCYIAHVVGEIGERSLEAEEVEEGQVVLWLPPKKVLEKMQTDVSSHQQSLFILERDKSFIAEYLAN